MSCKIIIHFENPPIPIRNFDWCATRDGWEPGDPIGWGKIPQVALQDLLDEEETLLEAEDEMLAADLAYAMEEAP